MTETNKSERQTKAGLLEKNGEKETDDAGRSARQPDDREQTPKISKEKAESDQRDKPVH